MNAIPPKPTNEKPVADLKVSEPRVQTLATRLGRGRLGGSTICDLIVQRGRRAGRPVMVAGLVPGRGVGGGHRGEPG